MPSEATTIVNAILIKNDNQENVLRFKINEGYYDLNLQSNNSEEIKIVFIELSQLIRSTPIKIEVTKDVTIDDKKDSLFMEATDEYILQLNNELLELENDEDLKCIRQFVKRVDGE